MSVQLTDSVLAENYQYIFHFPVDFCLKVQSYFSKILCAKRSIVNNIPIYEAQLRQQSLSNQAAFCWTAERICIANFNEILSGELCYLQEILLNAWIPTEITRITKLCQAALI